MLATGGYGGGGCRIIQFNSCSPKAMGFCYTKTLQLTSSLFVGLPPFSPNQFKFLHNPFCFSIKKPCNNGLRVSFEVRPNSSDTQNPHLLDCSSQSEVGLETPSDITSPLAGAMVALGKFDALHIGHRELAIQAAKMGVPYLLSFVGMAEVLGWEPRAPIVAKCDRTRILSTWSQLCGSMAPKEFEVEFSKVRSLTPRQFVEKLSKELGVGGVVAGQNYRFGYRAAGNASDLVKLCREYGMDAYIISSVMDKNQESRNIDSGDSEDQGQVSSTRVRCALARGDMKYVSELLGRNHRLVLAANNHEISFSSRNRMSAPRSSLLNLPPKDGLYENCFIFIDEKNATPCRVIIETTHVHIELDEVDICTRLTSPDTQLLGIEFGELEFGGV